MFKIFQKNFKDFDKLVDYYDKKRKEQLFKENSYFKINQVK